MARAVYQYYKFENGMGEVLEKGTEHLFAEKHQTKVVRSNNNSVRRIKDGFKAGFHYGLGEYVGGPRELARKLNQRGFVEVGKEKLKPDEAKPVQLFDDDTLKELVSNGAELSGEEIKSLQEIKTDPNSTPTESQAID